MAVKCGNLDINPSFLNSKSILYNASKLPHKSLKTAGQRVVQAGRANIVTKSSFSLYILLLSTYT